LITKTFIAIALLFSIPAMSFAMSSRPSIEQEYLFEFSHVNFAWGFQMSGMYVDKQGSVYTYNHSHSPWKPLSERSLTGEDLKEKYAHKKELVSNIEKAVLNKMHKLISPADAGEIVKSQQKCFDSGSGMYTAYLFDSKTEQYKPVLLYQFGDRPQKNMSAEAKLLYEWLFEVFGNKPNTCTP
jgi:hypothetical protein